MYRTIQFAIAIAALIMVGCAKEKAHHLDGKPKHTVTSPMLRDTVLINEYVCQIHSFRNIELRAQERGYLKESFVDEGQYAQKGQTMFQISPQLYQAELEKAEAETRFAEVEYLNTKSLADSNVVSENELALAKAKFDKAKAEQTLAEIHLGFTNIKAPFGGIMDRLHVRPGSLVEEGELLTTLSDNSKLWVYFNVPEAEYLDYKLNSNQGDLAHVKLKMANGEIFAENGVVETIEAEFNPETGNIPFRATFSNREGLLRHGETGNILMSFPLENALIIPQKATYEVLDKKYVYVVDEAGVVHSRQIELNVELPHIFVVREGITAEDQILLDGLRRVSDGDTIRVDYQDPEKVLSETALYAE